MLTTWTVDQPEMLAEALAWLYLRKERHAARVTQALDPGRAALPGRTVENAITALSVRIDDLADALASPDDAKREGARAKRETRIEHRDGLLFQHISWIAAYMRLPNAKATPPHVRQADKGFDGVLLEIDPSQTALSRIVLCEDKASINPRSLVTGSIWPEIKLIQADAKDREILAALTAILDTMPEVDQESGDRCDRVAGLATVPRRAHRGQRPAQSRWLSAPLPRASTPRREAPSKREWPRSCRWIRCVPILRTWRSGLSPC